MRRFILLTLICLCLILLSSAAYSDDLIQQHAGVPEERPAKLVMGYLSPTGVIGTTTPFIDIAPETVFPDPVQPGKDLAVTMRAINKGGIYSQNITIEMLGGDAFHLKKTDDRSKNLRLLCPLCSVKITYYLTVDPNTRSGVYPLKFMVISDKVSSEYELMVNIVAAPYLVIENVSTTPEKLIPGTSFLLNIDVRNAGSGNARDATVSLLLNNELSLSNGKLIMVPSKDNLLYVKEIGSGDVKHISFPLMIDKKAETGLKQAYAVIHATDDSGTFNFSGSEIIGLNIVGNAVLAPASIITDPAIVKRKENFVLITRIENGGMGDANQVNAEINLPFSGVKKVFIGNIKADGDMPAVFNLEARGMGTKEYNITIKYSDDTGQHEVSYPLEIYVTPNLSIVELIVLGVIIIDIILYFLYRKKSVIYRAFIKLREIVKKESDNMTAASIIKSKKKR